MEDKYSSDIYYLLTYSKFKIDGYLNQLFKYLKKVLQAGEGYLMSNLCTPLTFKSPLLHTFFCFFAIHKNDMSCCRQKMGDLITYLTHQKNPYIH